MKTHSISRGLSILTFMFCVFLSRGSLAAVQPWGTPLGSFNGVVNYSNDPLTMPSPEPNNYINGHYIGEEWQCVEYPRRYYYTIYQMDLYSLGGSMNARDFFSHAANMQLTPYANGGINAPQVGDILCFSETGSGLGHVAIIRAVGSSTVTVIQENVKQGDTGPNGTDDNYSFAYNSSTKVVDVLSAGSSHLGTTFYCQGWLRKNSAQTLPDLTISGPVTVSPTSVASGGTIRVDWTEKNIGTAASTPAHHTKIYLSANQYGTTYLVSGPYAVYTLGVGATQGYYDPAIVVPASIPAGNYYVTAFVDCNQEVSEGSNEGNNIGSSTPTTLAVSITSTRIISLGGNLAFGSVAVNSSVQSTLTIYNTGNSTMTVNSISYPSGFSGSWSGTIAAGSSQPVTVTFSPSSATSYGGTVTVNSDATSGGNTIAASGTGTVSPTRIISLGGNLAFGSVTVNSSAQSTLTIYNTGNSTMTVNSISYPSGFSGSWSGTISAGGSHAVTVTFSPTSATSYGGTVTVNSDATSGVNTIAASGTGTQTQPAITSPIPGSTLTSSSVTFQWSSGTSVTNYYLSVGNSSGTNDIYGQYLGPNLATTVTGSPTDRRMIYVELFYEISGSWYVTDYTYISGGHTVPAPTISAFNVTPLGNSVGGQFTITYTVADAGGAGLKQVELWRFSDNDGTWTVPQTTLCSGTSSFSGNFYDTPPVVGGYWYGLHVVDVQGTTKAESDFGLGPISVVVTNPPPVTKIISLSGNMAFGNATVGTSAQSTLTIANTGNSTLTVSGISYPSGFNGNWSGAIAAGGSQPVSVTFSPTSATSYGGTVTVNSDATFGVNTTTASGTGTPRALTVSGITAVNRTYDGTTVAALNTIGATLNGVLAGDTANVTLVTSGAAGAFANKNVGNNKSVNISGLTLSGSAAANYTLTQPTATANIAPAGLNVSGLTASSKVYDGTMSATITGTPVPSGVFGSDAVSFSGTASGNFASKAVGNNISVTVSGLTLSGADAGNYTLSLPTLNANITLAGLNVSGLTASSKVYDGTTSATITGTPVPSGVFGSDAVSFSGTASGNFASKAVGNNISVTVSGLTLSGTDAGNYTLSLPTLNANLTPLGLTVTGITAASKVYDGTATATLNTSGAALVGVLSMDTGNVTLVTSGVAGEFADKNVGTGKLVMISGLTLSGTAAGNYTVIEPTTTADIVVNSVFNISSSSLVGHQFSVVVSTVPGANYTLEFKNSLGDSNWTVAESLPGTGGAITLTDGTATNSSRFYQVLVQ